MEETTIINWKERPCAKPVWSGSRGAISAASTPGPGEREGRGLTLSELGMEYSRTAAALYARMKAAEEDYERAGDEASRIAQAGRLRLLRGMYRECRATGEYLTHYYDHRRGGGSK